MNTANWLQRQKLLEQENRRRKNSQKCRLIAIFFTKIWFSCSWFSWLLALVKMSRVCAEFFSFFEISRIPSGKNYYFIWDIQFRHIPRYRLNCYGIVNIALIIIDKAHTAIATQFNYNFSFLFLSHVTHFYLEFSLFQKQMKLYPLHCLLQRSFCFSGFLVETYLNENRWNFWNFLVALPVYVFGHAV